MLRRRIIVILCALLAVSGLAGFEIGTARTALAQPDVITVTMQTPDQPAYQWQGFGTSLAWWANVVGGFSSTRSQIEDALFGTSTPQDPNRLGLNVLRYNIGASPTTGNPPSRTLPACRGSATRGTSAMPYRPSRTAPASLSFLARTPTRSMC